MSKILFLSSFILLVSFSIQAQNVAINSTGNNPNASAMLDISSTNTGLLIPRVNLSATNNNSPVGAGIAISLLVYNTATAGVSPNNVTPGYYFWDGIKWVRILDATTADDYDWEVIGNNVVSGHGGLYPSGNVGIGTNSPQRKLHIRGTSGNAATFVVERTSATTSALAIIPESNLVTLQAQATATSTTARALRFRTGTSERMRITTAGYVGIGTTTPSTRLEVQESSSSANGVLINTLATSNTYYGLDVQTAGTSRLYVRADGNVGVGTIIPDKKLTIDGDVQLEGGIRTLHFDGTQGIIKNNNNNGSLIFYLGTGKKFEIWENTHIKSMLQHKFIRGSAAEPSINAQEMTFNNCQTTGIFWPTDYTIAISTDATERMRINGSGNVGINTTNPLLKLDVRSVIGIATAVATPQNFIKMSVTTGGSTIYFHQDEKLSFARLSDYSSFFASSSQIMTLDGPTKRVGIGTTNPGHLLDVYYDGSAMRAARIRNATNASGQHGLLISTTRTASDAYILNLDAGGSSRMYVRSDGRVGIGTTTPAYQLQLTLNSAAKPTSSSWTVVSDKRLKTNISRYNAGLSEILEIEPVWFTYTGEAEMPLETGVGVIAQDLQKIAPYMVTEWDYENTESEKTTYLGVDNGAMTYMLINAIKEQQESIEFLLEQNKILQKQIEEMQKQLLSQ